MEIPSSSYRTPSQDKALSGRNRRLLHEWQRIEQELAAHPEIQWQVNRTNAEGLPTGYLIDYHIRSFCGVDEKEQPVWADSFRMQIELPDSFPCVDGAPIYRFQTEDENGQPIPHPWHPNIRYYGPFAGRVCLNTVDTYMDIIWAIKRVASYLRYERYHALSEPPYPEDLQVAAWVIRKAEPKGWI